MSLSELNRQARELEEKGSLAQAEVVEVITDKDQMFEDLKEALALLKSSQLVLGYIGDPNIIPRVSNRERSAMMLQSQKIGSYLDAVDGFYDAD